MKIICCMFLIATLIAHIVTKDTEYLLWAILFGVLGNG